MPRPVREGDWKPMTLTLSGQVRTRLRLKAAQVGWEPGKTADAMLGFALENWERPCEAMDAEALRKLFRAIEVHWNQDEFFEWLGTLIQDTKKQTPDPLSTKFEGAKEVIRWWRNQKVEPRWRDPIIEHLREARGIKPSWLPVWG